MKTPAPQPCKRFTHMKYTPAFIIRYSKRVVKIYDIYVAGEGSGGSVDGCPSDAAVGQEFTSPQFFSCFEKIK